jgi:hypothetical protein
VDVYQIHTLVAWREHLPVLEDLAGRGAVRVVGATHYQHSALGDLMAVMRTGRVGMVQIPYNATDRAVEREVLPLADELGIGVLVMQPLGSGALVRVPPPARDLAPLEPRTARAVRGAHVGPGAAQVGAERPSGALRAAGDEQAGARGRERGGGRSALARRGCAGVRREPRGARELAGQKGRGCRYCTKR